MGKHIAIIYYSRMILMILVLLVLQITGELIELYVNLFYLYKMFFYVIARYSQNSFKINCFT